MRYIITENQLEKFKLSIIDQVLGEYYSDRVYGFIIIYSIIDEENDYKDVQIEYDLEDGRLFVNKEIADKLTSLLGNDEKDVQNLIKKWFEYEFGEEVKYMEVK
jgi:hypothetical protein